MEINAVSKTKREERSLVTGIFNSLMFQSPIKYLYYGPSVGASLYFHTMQKIAVRQ